MSQGILSGMRVIEGSAFVAAPLGGMTLAQLGADVIRFDPIGGGLDYSRWPVTKSGESLFWAGLNKGKRSIQLDIRKPEAQALVRALLTKSGPDGGLFLTNFPAKGWLSFDSLSESRDDLIYVNIVGDRKGGSEVDYTVNPAVGFAEITGDGSDLAPTNHVLPAWDNITGQMAATALLAAERHRRLTGKGQYISLALKDVALATAGHLGNIAEAMLVDEPREKSGNYLYGAFGKDFLTSTGHRFMVVALTSKQWQALVTATALAPTLQAYCDAEQVDLTSEGTRYEHRAQIETMLAPWFMQRTGAEVATILKEHNVCFGPYQSFKSLISHDEDCSIANPLFEYVDQPGIGKYLVPASPIRFTASSNIGALKAPTLGEHTEQILAEDLGLASHQIAQLFDQKVVA